jgi:drug/metabolite transporter (DMT)-like permease
MLNNNTRRRVLAVALVALGAVMIFLTTNTLAGALLMVLGISIEGIGIVMRHK